MTKRSEGPWLVVAWANGLVAEPVPNPDALALAFSRIARVMPPDRRAAATWSVSPTNPWGR